jgi:hypothetical protein
MNVELNISGLNVATMLVAQMLHDRFLAKVAKVRRGPRPGDVICFVGDAEENFPRPAILAIVAELAKDLELDYITVRVEGDRGAQRVGPAAWRGEGPADTTHFVPF